MMDVVAAGRVVFVGMRRVPCNGASNVLGHSRNGGTLWLVTMIIGDIGNLNVLAFGRNPAVLSLDVTVLITAAALCDVVVGLPRCFKAIGTHIVLALNDISVHILGMSNWAMIVVGHWVRNRMRHWVWWAGMLDSSQGHSENSTDHQLKWWKTFSKLVDQSI